MSGEIRNIQVLGIIGERVVIAYQGKGRVRAFIDHAHNLELPEEPEMVGPLREKYHKYGGGKNYRYAEYKKPSLPVNIVALGDTEQENPEVGGVRKPSREAKVRASISLSGHVTKSHHELLS